MKMRVKRRLHRTSMMSTEPWESGWTLNSRLLQYVVFSSTRPLCVPEAQHTPTFRLKDSEREIWKRLWMKT